MNENTGTQSEYSIIEDVKIGKGTVLRHHLNLYGCEIGMNCKIASFVEIQRGVTIGNNCKIEAFAFIPSGVFIEDDVFIGPHVSFTNDKIPLATGEWEVTATHVRKGASIGANATIICGIEIGEYALIGAGSVVTKNVEAKQVVAGVPAKPIGTIGSGKKLYKNK